MTARTVTGDDGLRISVSEEGRDSGPVVVAVHGYPDDHTVWSGVAQRLGEHCRVVRYDVRGAGASQRPATREGYRMPLLVGDLVRVVDEFAAGDAVHLLGHDWGSIQCWAAIGDERSTGRIASFTSISGPSLDYAAAWLRNVRAHPRDTLRQVLHSAYVPVFLLPKLAELAIRRDLLTRLSKHRATRGDQLDGLNLYRANIGHADRPRRVPPGVRVQLISPERDPYVTPAFAEGAARPWVDDLRTRRVPGGHWTMCRRPETVADLVLTHIGV